MSAHTPGDWFAKRDGFSTVYIECRIRPGVLQEVAACGPTEAGPKQQEASARLIAAAPDLLVALKTMNAYWESGNFTRRTELWDVMRAAIDKAEGGVI